VVIGGYTQPRGGRSHFGALVVGLYRDKALHYVAHTGGGFNQQTLKSVQTLTATEEQYLAFCGPAENQRAGTMGEAKTGG